VQNWLMIKSVILWLYFSGCPNGHPYLIGNVSIFSRDPANCR